MVVVLVTVLPATEQGSQHRKEGVILLGDVWNMRHPLTGGRMTVALHDVVILTQLLKTMHNLGDWDEMSVLLHWWHWGGKPLASSINILSVALYNLFLADGVVLFILYINISLSTNFNFQTHTWLSYVQGASSTLSLVGNASMALCLSSPGSFSAFLLPLSSSNIPSPSMEPLPLLLFYHFFSVAFYSIWVLFTHPHPVSPSAEVQDNPSGPKVAYAIAQLNQYPELIMKSICIVHPLQLSCRSLFWSDLPPVRDVLVLDCLHRVWAFGVDRD
jgi:squalene monooxygenase